MATKEQITLSTLEAQLKELQLVYGKKCCSNFAIRKNGIDEYIETDEQGAIAFAREILRSVRNKENGYAEIRDKVFANQTDIKPLYIKFTDQPANALINSLEVEQLHLAIAEKNDLLINIGYIASLSIIVSGFIYGVYTFFSQIF
ncbi:MAG: hypothetical protein ACFCUU_02390 [Cyclobacteriaceae bacterium]